MQLDQPNITKKPSVISAKRKTADLPLIENTNEQSSPIRLQDYVNAVVVNEAGRVLILEGTLNGRSWSSWQLIGRALAPDEDPLLAAEKNLLLRLGYVCKKWIYLGTFIIDDTQKQGAGHFFCAQHAKKIAIPDAKYMQHLKLKWVTKTELKQALLDGRIAVINHATAASLAMVMCRKFEET